ncbi:hypothetical protein A3A38_03710 [Candidatus Kaiserbacteria bacterium RIFCSPLOWO2_01_FULL_53_17]|uniref:DUF4389 domain-containing protein n=1 Tax=Candidatus Kaiserbacteria bacterium RIFCSPLOWO2_01_FULL_53_17 TaxID=1798511 RepID=A0A1F6EGJ0_9BACT|nr:MAG: hypothetical protein A3A38_03710 [Candidatus Kaiserbacteria bacterium RIFCSPLOWO2_01_FULL_53_17]
MRPEQNSVQVTIPAPEKSSRLLAAMTLLFMIPKMIILIPHLIVLWFLGIAGFFAALAGQIVVLFTGTYPPQMHEFVIGVVRWRVRLAAYLFGLRDEYPPFTLRN